MGQTDEKQRAELVTLVRELQGKDLKEFRLQAGMSQAEFAQLLNVSLTYIQRLEAKESILSLIVLFGFMWLKGKKSARASIEQLRENRRQLRVSGKQFRRERKKLGLSQERMAQMLGVSFTTVNRWENGHVDITTVPMIGMALEYIKQQLSEEKVGMKAA